MGGEWIADARTRLVRGVDPEGRPLVSLLIKRAYRFAFGRGLVETVAAAPWVEAPVVESLPDRPGTVLRQDSELFPYKRFTDIVVDGHVVVPGGRPTRELTITVSAGSRRKNILVVGDRIVEGGRISEPEPFVWMPLCWSRAYGGIDMSVGASPDGPITMGGLLEHLHPEEHPGAYPRNPVGTGWVLRASDRELDGLQLPNFEHPRRRLGPRLALGDAHWRDAPAPQSLGWAHTGWAPRSRWLGLTPGPDGIKLDPARPDLRFANGAAFSARLGMGDAVELIGFAGEGVLRLPLPLFPRVTMLLERERLDVEVVLHTAHTNVDTRVLTLVWAARARTPRALPLSLPELEDTSFAPFAGLTVDLDGQLLPHTAELLQ